MKKVLLSLALLALVLPAVGQQISQPEFEGESCTSIMVGKRASKDGSVITSHTCDGRYRTWMYIEPAADHEAGEVHLVYKGTLHTTFRGDTTAWTPQWQNRSLDEARGHLCNLLVELHDGCIFGISGAMMPHHSCLPQYGYGDVRTAAMELWGTMDHAPDYDAMEMR